MCEICTHSNTITLQTYRNVDPTNTTSLRNAFVRDMNRRFKELTTVIRKAIVTEDCFGLQTGPTTQQVNTPGYRAFAFSTNPDKVNSFMEWLQRQENKTLLQTGQATQVGTAANAAWTDRYILDSYKRGVERARYEMEKAGIDVPKLSETGGIEVSMNGPMHVQRVGMMYARTFQELKGITAAMDTQISHLLSMGLIDGDGPRAIARKLVAAIDGAGMGSLGITDSLGRFIPARRRAEILARTEIIRAHHQANIQEYKNWAVEGVQVQAEFMTAEDDRVCPECQALVGNGPLPGGAYPLDVIEYMIPVHPQCRCVALPFNVSR